MATTSAGLAGAANAESSQHKHTNRLAKEESPYLLQHAHNPVDWYPWGEEAFAKAKAEKKPIFLSVGYSTCHWCHVMEHESFESEEVAAIMNADFVNIKVDREERPDVDKVYMTYVQATGTGGGWPMSVFLTPDLVPFFGGTYFPPSDSFGRPGFKSMLRRIKEVWDTRQSDLVESGASAMAQLAEATENVASSQEFQVATAQQIVAKGAEDLAARYDKKRGGFGSAPKFPRPVEINLLFRRLLRLTEKGDKTSDAVREMVLHSLTAMARGGIHDHVGGGFHRYSVDEYWHVPHFEKMLYDQGQLANAYLDAFLVTRDNYYAQLARDILDYLRRDMTHPGGGIFSAEDADSADVPGGKKKEGLFYIWTEAEIEEVLGPERAPPFKAHYYVKKQGNCDLSRMSDPHHEFGGKNVLIERTSLEETAKKFDMDVPALERQLAESRRLLHGRREQRPHPHLDDKIIVAWNGLAMSAFARASTILKKGPAEMEFHFPVEGTQPSEYLQSAVNAATFIREKLYDPDCRTLRRSFREGPSAAAGFVDDYAFLINALLDLHEAGAGVKWLDWALELQKTQDDLFFDKEGGAYYSNAAGDPSILLRMKEDYDGAEPSGNSVAAGNLLRLSKIIAGDAGQEYRKRALHTMAVFEDRLKTLPIALPQMCCALDLYASPSERQVVIAGARSDERALSLLQAAHSVYEPDRAVLLIDEDNEEDRAFWSKHNEMVLKMAKKKDGQPQAYVCQNFTCQAPTADPARVEELLRQPLSGSSSPKMDKIDLGALRS
ncbi:Six-hairpin glycosidase-like domain containing protein [Klebsormidium nitens]|uniref:Six-hairpin glycosidase-like domain containing protein n=1 Tax=Klebsormidium nitens TaxID=105231 RepID=A0A0U9I6E1_KLENI|nr:Six-hairpin glycosidase-like domain containing protein [Klebsormidium nitens]|eukprot:GAQ78020.1 Six-hairpin glycosidase-like domain containing protein [Klebsormidium nitens]